MAQMTPESINSSTSSFNPDDSSASVTTSCERKQRGVKRKTSFDDSISSSVEVHHQQQHHPCQLCGLEFDSASTLRQHVDTLHMRSNMWSCVQCGKLFTSKSNLKVHLRVHTGIRPYHCKYCKYSCMHHSSIKEHLIKLHPQFQHCANSPGYIFNSHAVPEPEAFNSTTFNREQFIADANTENEKLSEQLANQLVTPPSPIPQFSHQLNDTPIVAVKRQKLIKSNRAKKTKNETPTTRQFNPFSIEYILNTPVTPKPIDQQQNQQQLILNAWLYANSLQSTFNWLALQNSTQ